MLKVEVILGIIASSIAITAFLARAIANVRQGRRASEARGRNRSSGAKSLRQSELSDHLDDRPDRRRHVGAERHRPAPAGQARRGDGLDPRRRRSRSSSSSAAGARSAPSTPSTPATCSSCASSARSSASAATASRRSRPGRAPRRCRRRSRASASRWTTAPAAAEGTISSGPAISEETQPVYAVVTLNYRVSDKAVQELFTDVGSTFFDKVVAPRVFQVFKNETVKFKSVAVAPNREQIRQAVQLELDRQLDRLLDRRRRLPDQRPRLPAGVHAGDRAQAGRDPGRARGAAEGRAVEGRGAAGDRARARPGAGAAAPGELADRPQPPVRGAADPQGGAAADRLPAGRPGQPARSVDVPEVRRLHALIEFAAQ